MESNSPLVLVVDDNPQVLDLTSLVLTHAGYRAETASDGPAALTWAQENQPDLILLDLLMPDMDGLAVLRALRSDPQTADIPVVVVTASAQPSAPRDAKSIGADGFWQKHLYKFRYCQI